MDVPMESRIVAWPGRGAKLASGAPRGMEAATTRVIRPTQGGSTMLGRNGSTNGDGKSASATSLLTIVGESARIEGKFDIADSIEIECEIGGELSVGRKLVISQRGVVKANVHTVDAVIQGTYEGTMIATGEVEIASTGRVSGHIETDSLVIAKGGVFTGNVTKSGGGESKPVYLLDDKRMTALANHVGAER